MATATLGLLNHTEIDDADDATSWSGLTTPDNDIKKEGTASESGVFRADATVGYYDDATIRSASGKHLRMWVNTTNSPYMETFANGGYEVYMYDGTNTQYITFFGSDTYAGGWFNLVIDCALFTSLTLANARRWGIRCQHTANAKNVVNTWVDFIRYTDGYYVTGGTLEDKVRLTDIATADKGTTTLYGYGIVENIEGVYLAYGKLQIGNGSTTTYFEMDGDVLVFTDKPVGDGLYAINGNGSGCDVVIVNSTIKASGTGNDNRPDINMVTGSPNSVSITSTVFIRGGTFTFTSGQTITGNTFNDCGQIIAGGADLTNCIIQGYEGTSDTGALSYDVAIDPDGYLDNMEFTKGTASTHAIVFGDTIPSSITLRDCSFSGYNTSNGQADSTLYFADTTGTITVNLIGCSGNISYKSAGATISLVTDPITFQVTVRDVNTNAVIENARVLVWVTDGTNYPYQESVTITSSGTTATVSHTGHGMVTNDYVIIVGANEDAYNGVHQITYISADSYSYTMADTASSPATGTITATFAVISGLTNSGGIISDSRSWTSSQPIAGRVRKATIGTLYKEQPIADIIDNANGLSITVLLIPDE